MRICIITSFSTPGWGGGITTHLKILVKALVENNEEVIVLTGVVPQSGRAEENIEGAVCEVIPGVGNDIHNPQFWQACCQVFEKINQEKSFDLILSEGSSAFGVYKKRNFGIPIIALLHQFKIIHLFNCFQEVKSFRTLAIYGLKTVPKIFYDAIFQEWPFYRGCAGIICGAKHIVHQIKKYYRVDSNKIAAIPYWIDDKRFKADPVLKASARRQLGLPDNCFVFLIVSRIQITKGIDVSLKAFSRVIKNMPDAYLVIAGGGNETLLNSYKVLARRLNIDKKTIFAGMISEEFLPCIYNLADVFIMPSVLIEVLPYTLLEAMATGLPIIATKRPGNYEALDNAGIYVDVGDYEYLANAMLQIYTNNSSRKNFAQKSFKRFQENFTIDKSINRYINFLNKIAGKPQ
ncbi:MAG: glycosyltransferase family 4 protein [Elusimicrobia bacterium]|nr:glycosyltransferase family 4 protein [Elusimicrobiota bacterium]